MKRILRLSIYFVLSPLIAVGFSVAVISSAIYVGWSLCGDFFDWLQ